MVDKMSAVTGSKLLTPVANATGLALDQVNFVAMQAVALGLAVLYRRKFSPRGTSAGMRHAIALAFGTAIGLFCFGGHMMHVFMQAGGCYVLMKWAPENAMHILVFVFAIVYLSVMHLYNYIYNYGNWALDITGPLMILTQKMTSLALSVHDGMYKTPQALRYDQAKYAVRSLPSPVVFFSYVLSFQGLLAGPLCFFNDYVAFVEGKNFPIEKPIIVDRSVQIPEKEKRELRPEMAVVKKVAGALLALVLSLIFAPRFSKLKNVDKEFIASTGFFYRVWFLLVSVLLSRFRYYFAWLLGEAVCNASGLGFNGYDEKGRQRWDLVRNVNVYGIETATSFKGIVDNWNTQTAVWLKKCCYERVPFSKTLMTYCLSAVWHGFYPGYYFSFVSAAFATMAARAVRRRVRPMFTGNRWAHLLYDVVTWFSAQLTLAYLVVPFTAWQFWLIINFYHNSMFWFLHVIIILILVFLPYKSTAHAQASKPQPTQGSESSAPGSSDREPVQRRLSKHLREFSEAVDGLDRVATDALGMRSTSSSTDTLVHREVAQRVVDDVISDALDNFRDQEGGKGSKAE